MVVDLSGEVRWQANPIVRWLLDTGGKTLNDIAHLPGVTDEERRQFAQLIGYSVNRYGELSYVPLGIAREADARAAGLKTRTMLKRRS